MVWLGLLTVIVASTGANAQEPIGEAVPATIPSAVPIAPRSDSSGEAKARPVTVTAELLSGLKITGVLVDNMQLAMQTTFGQASIPMAEIAAVRLASRDDTTTTIVMLNGDSITGATDLKIVTIETEWGSAKINGSAIQSLFFVPEVQWTRSNSISGPRWILVDGKPAQGPSLASPNLGATGTSTQNRPTIPGSVPSSVPGNLPNSLVVPR